MIITFLTGRRPDLLKRTLQSTFKHMPELVDEEIMALANGGDKPTLDVLESFGVPYMKTKSLLPIGPAISLLAEYAMKSRERYWLHIEDDWEASKGGINYATKILDNNPNISQVRLRHISEPVLTKHMVTGEPIVWQKAKGFNYAKAHMTFNPNIIRAKDIPKAFPCTGERHAQRRWLSNGLIAQLNPGMFKHIGGEDSLRLKTGIEV